MGRLGASVPAGGLNRPSALPSPESPPYGMTASMDRTRGFVLIGAIVALGVQLVLWAQPPAAPSRLLSGDDLAAVGSGWLTPRLAGRCVPVYFASPTCAACAVLASRWRDVVPTPRGIWVVQGHPEVARQFQEMYGIPSEQFVATELDGREGRTLVQLGVFATPTTAILDAQGRFQHVRVRPELVDSSEIARYCTS